MIAAPLAFCRSLAVLVRVPDSPVIEFELRRMLSLQRRDLLPLGKV